MTLRKVTHSYQRSIIYYGTALLTNALQHPAVRTLSPLHEIQKLATRLAVATGFETRELMFERHPGLWG